MEFTYTFFYTFSLGVYFVAPVLLLFATLIISLGAIVSKIESWPLSTSIYWAFITALTVGYGDVRPTLRASRVLSVVIAIFGIMLAGILVAITVEATSIAFEKHIRPTLRPMM